MDLKCIAVIVFFLGMVGCVKEDVEPPSEFDIKGEVFALVSPDTVQVGQPFKVQISFPTVCGGTFSHIIQNNSIGTVTLTSVIHVIAQTECPGSGFIETETTSVKLDTLGLHLVVADGRFGQLSKAIQVVSSPPLHQNYILHYLFVNPQRMPKPGQYATFIFPDRIPLQSFLIQSDTNGIWETTFNDTLPQVRYTIGDITFEAVQRIKEDGVILYQ